MTLIISKDETSAYQRKQQKRKIKQKSNTTSTHNPSIAKKTYQSKTAELVPNFAAR
jgi:hypothetical protein